MREKNINIIAARIAVTIGLSRVDVDKMTDDVFDMLVEDQNGPKVTDGMIRGYLIDMLDKAKSGAEDLVSGVTEPVGLPPEPVDEWEEIGSYSMKDYTRTPGNPKSAGRLPRDFNKHVYPVKFVFNNNCGEFTIPTANAEYDKEGKEGYYFHKWHKGSPVVFTKAFSDKRAASSVTAYRHK